MARKPKDYSKPHPIRGVLALALGAPFGHYFRVEQIKAHGPEVVHSGSFILTVAIAIIGPVIVGWMALNNKRPALLTVPLFFIAAGITACVWK